jgi:hypothetical protein
MCTRITICLKIAEQALNRLNGVDTEGQNAHKTHKVKSTYCKQAFGIENEMQNAESQ